jgi:hypothetical protein
LFDRPKPTVGCTASGRRRRTIPLAVIFPRAARDPAALTGVAVCHEKVGDPWFRVSIDFG